MTPLLLGRWETRLFLLGTVGSLVTVIYGAIFTVIYGASSVNFTTPFAVLGYVILFGFAWDALYQYILLHRWDQDWPTTFQVAAGIIEGALIWVLVHYVGLPGANKSLLFVQFLPHYGTVWLSFFIISQGPLRIILPRWRYRGGQWF